MGGEIKLSGMKSFSTMEESSVIFGEYKMGFLVITAPGEYLLSAVFDWALVKDDISLIFFESDFKIRSRLPLDGPSDLLFNLILEDVFVTLPDIVLLEILEGDELFVVLYFFEDRFSCFPGESEASHLRFTWSTGFCWFGGFKAMSLSHPFTARSGLLTLISPEEALQFCSRDF